MKPLSNNSFIGNGTIAGGAEDVTLIDDNDYIGNVTAETGWYSFGNVRNAFRIANIDRPSPDVDIALVNYVMTRKGGDMRVHTHCRGKWPSLNATKWVVTALIPVVFHQNLFCVVQNLLPILKIIHSLVLKMRPIVLTIKISLTEYIAK